MGVAFSPDGNKLATVGFEGVLRLWEAPTIMEVERYPPTQQGLFRLGQLRMNENRYEEAELIFAKLLKIQRRYLPSGHDDIARTRSQLAIALNGQNLLPDIIRHPDSVEAEFGDTVRLGAEVSPGDWSLQWFCNGQPVVGATQPELRFQLDREEQFGAYHIEAAPVGRDDATARSDLAFVFEPVPGDTQGLLWEVFEDILGDSVGSLTTVEKYPEQPDTTGLIDNFQIPPNAGDNYGGRVSGWLIPPATGEYEFHTVADDNGQLFLNSDSSSVDGVRLIASTRWTRATSMPVYLERGKPYAIRALFKENGGDDNLSVSWRLPGQPPPPDGSLPPIPGIFLQHRLE